jgi:hypothetical protein
MDYNFKSMLINFINTLLTSDLADEKSEIIYNKTLDQITPALKDQILLNPTNFNLNEDTLSALKSMNNAELIRLICDLKGEIVSLKVKNQKIRDRAISINNSLLKANFSED